MGSFDSLINFIHGIYADNEGIVPLHAPIFLGNEKAYLNECIDTGWVSSIGPFVDQFELEMRKVTGADYCIPTVNGTTALHTALVVAGVDQGSLVLTQGLTFVATANAIVHAGACPIFLDSDKDSLGMSPSALQHYLTMNACKTADGIKHRRTGQKILACVPVHILGHNCSIDDITQICSEWGIPVIEDASEALGSHYANRALGTVGLMGVFSFNGNKTITTGGGGAIVTSSPELAARAKHLTTTAKVPHPWDFFHDAVAWNYRMPNINAALGCAQLEMLPRFLAAKRRLAAAYREFIDCTPWRFIDEPAGCSSNFWLCSIEFFNSDERYSFLQEAAAHNLMARPLWRLMPDLPMYSHCEQDSLTTARELVERVVCLPSSVPPSWL